MKGHRFPQEFINTILEQIKTSGKSVPEICSENNLNQKTVYTWIRKASFIGSSGSSIGSSSWGNNSTGNNNSSNFNNLLLENQRLKREKQELIELIGKLTINVDKLAKKKDRLF